MSILSTNHRLIKVGQDYSAGSGISIDDHVISVTGNQEASIVVQSNSATWNEISAVSGSYWPLSSSFTAKNAKVDINGLVNQHLVLNGAYPNIKGFVDGQSYWNWEINSTHVSGHNWEYGASEYNKLNSSYEVLSSNSGTWNEVSSKQDKLTFKYGTTSGSISSINGSAIIDDYTYHMLNVTRVGLTNLTRNVSSNSGTWNEVSTTVQTNSAQWSDSTGDEEVNEFVYNNSATINNVDSVVQSNSAAWGNEFDPSYMSGAIDNKLDESAFANVSGSFLTAHQSLDGYATENWVTAQGYITGVDLSEYAKTNDVLDDINSAVSGKLDTTSFSTVSGNFLTAHQDLSDYYTTAEADTLSSMLSGAIDYVSANAGDEFPASANEAIEAYQTNSGTYLTAHQIIPSAKWEDASDCVQTNSAQWAQGGGSPSGFVSGSNVLFVPNEHIPGQGKVYSANISGDITVKYGDYFNSGENINIYATYSLSSVGSQIGEKLNKSVIEDSKTLSIIDDKAEVYSFAYRPSEFVTTGITTDNYSGPESVNINIRTQDPYKLYSASLVIESDGFNERYIPDGWNFVNSANGSATFSRFYKDQNYDNINFPGFWDFNLTNASAYSVAYSGIVTDALAFKSDLTGQGGGVPQSAFDELKTSYDSLSASYAALSSLFATYSGQWLLPNEGV
jgi:hypothetical protein